MDEKHIDPPQTSATPNITAGQRTSDARIWTRHTPYLSSCAIPMDASNIRRWGMNKSI